MDVDVSGSIADIRSADLDSLADIAELSSAQLRSTVLRQAVARQTVGRSRASAIGRRRAAAGVARHRVARLRNTTFLANLDDTDQLNTRGTVSAVIAGNPQTVNQQVRQAKSRLIRSIADSVAETELNISVAVVRSSGASSQTQVGGILFAVDGDVGRQLHVGGQQVSDQNALNASSHVVASISDHPGTDDDLGARLSRVLIGESDGRSGIARSIGRSRSSVGRGRRLTAINGDISRDRQDRGLVELLSDDLSAADRVSAAIGDGPDTVNAESVGAERQIGVGINVRDQRALIAVIESSGDSQERGLNAILAADNNVSRESVEVRLSAVTNGDQLSVTVHVSASIHSSPLTLNGLRAQRAVGRGRVNITQRQNDTAAIIHSQRTTQVLRAKVLIALNMQISGELNKLRGSTINNGDVLDLADKVSANINGSPSTQDQTSGTQVSRDRIIIADAGNSSAVIRSSGLSNLSRSILSHTVNHSSSREEREDGSIDIADKDLLDARNSISTTISGSPLAVDVSKAASFVLIAISVSHNDRVGAAEIIGYGSSQSSNGSGSSTVDGDVSREILLTEERTRQVVLGDTLNLFDLVSAVIRGDPSTGSQDGAGIAGLIVMESDVGNTAGIGSAGSSSGGNGDSIVAVQVVDISREEVENGGSIVKQHDGLVAAEAVSTGIMSSPDTDDGTQAIITRGDISISHSGQRAGILSNSKAQNRGSNVATASQVDIAGESSEERIGDITNGDSLNITVRINQSSGSPSTTDDQRAGSLNSDISVVQNVLSTGINVSNSSSRGVDVVIDTVQDDIFGGRDKSADKETKVQAALISSESNVDGGASAGRRSGLSRSQSTNLVRTRSKHIEAELTVAVRQNGADNSASALDGDIDGFEGELSDIQNSVAVAITEDLTANFAVDNRDRADKGSARSAGRNPQINGTDASESGISREVAELGKVVNIQTTGRNVDGSIRPVVMSRPDTNVVDNSGISKSAELEGIAKVISQVLARETLRPDRSTVGSRVVSRSVPDEMGLSRSSDRNAERPLLLTDGAGGSYVSTIDGQKVQEHVALSSQNASATGRRTTGSYGREGKWGQIDIEGVNRGGISGKSREDETRT